MSQPSKAGFGARGRIYVVIAVAAAVAAGCAAGAGTAAPTSVPTPAPVAVVTAAPTTATPTTAAFSCEEETTGCAGPLAPGEHHTANFDHPFSFTIPTTGWSNAVDKGRAYTFRVAALPESEFIVWSQAAPQAQGASCDDREREPGYGTTTAEWLRYLAEHPGAAVLSTETFDVGGQTATRVEVGVKSTWARKCPGNTDPFVFLVTDTGNPPTRGHGIGASTIEPSASMTFIDVGTEAIVIWNDGGPPLSRMVDLALPIIKSIRFDP